MLFTWSFALLREKIKASTELDRMRKDVIVTQRGIGLAEETAAALKKAGGPVLTGQQRAIIAADYVQDKLPDKPLAAVKQDIKADVGNTVGVGASPGPVLVVKEKS